MATASRSSLEHAARASVVFDRFYGLDRSRDAAFLSLGYSPDAQNMDTSYGNLAVRRATLPFFAPDVADACVNIRNTHWVEARGKEYLVFSAEAQGSGRPGIYITTEALPQPDAEEAEILSPGTFKLWELDTTPQMLAENTATHFRLNSIAPYHMGTDRADVVLLFSVTALCEVGVLASQSGLFIFELTDDPTDFSAATRLIPLPSGSDPGAMADYEMGRTASHFTIAFGRMFAARADGSDSARSNRVYYSRTGDPRAWENAVDDELSGGYIDIGQDDGGRIVDIRTIYSEVVVFKTNGVYRIVGDRPSSFQILRIDDAVRCIGSACGLPTRMGFVTLCDDGLYLYTGNAMEYIAASDMLRPVWEQLQGMELDPADASQREPRLAACGNTLYIALTADQPVYEYDLLRATFMASRYSGVELFGLFSYKGKLLAASAGGYVRLRYRRATKDTVYIWQTNAYGEWEMVHAQLPIAAYWRTPDVDFSQKDIGKQPEWLHLCGCGATAADTAIARFPFLFVTVEAKGLRGALHRRRRGVNAGRLSGGVPVQFKLRARAKGRSFSILFENAWSEGIPSASSWFELASGGNLRVDLDGN